MLLPSLRGAGSAHYQPPLLAKEYSINIGIIGSGALCSNFARILAKNGVAATISNSRGPTSLVSLVNELGPFIKAGTVADAASAYIVLVAVRWIDAERVLRSLPDWNGRIVIDGTNP